MHPTARDYLDSRSTRHKGSLTIHYTPPHQDGTLHVVYAPCSMLTVNTKSKNCEGRGNTKNSFLSKKIKWQHRAQGSNQSSPNAESAGLPTPGDSYITNQPSNLILNQSERERLLPTFTGQVTSCLSLAWLGSLTGASLIWSHIYIFFSIIDICRSTRSNKQLGRVGEH